MLYQLEEVYIEAENALEAYAKYVNYKLDFAEHSGSKIPSFDVSKGPEQLSDKTAEEYFMPAFEKVCDTFPGAYFDGMMPRSEISVVLKENEYGDVALLVLYPTDIDDVFVVCVGTDINGTANFTILHENPYGGNFLSEVNKEAEEHLNKI